MKNTDGFTLIEILVALSVFAILATLTSSALYHAFSTRDSITRQADRLLELQLAQALLNRDTEHAINRSIQGNKRHQLPAFIGDNHTTEWTTTGTLNTESQAHSALNRVAYLCEKGQLIRRTWDVLDGSNRHHYTDKILINNLSDCHFAYLSHQHTIQTSWQTKASPPHEDPLPLAIQLTLDLEDWGNMSLLLILGGDF